MSQILFFTKFNPVHAFSGVYKGTPGHVRNSATCVNVCNEGLVCVCQEICAKVQVLVKSQHPVVKLYLGDLEVDQLPFLRIFFL